MQYLRWKKEKTNKTDNGKSESRLQFNAHIQKKKCEESFEFHFPPQLIRIDVIENRFSLLIENSLLFRSQRKLHFWEK